ncbi:unnamed protein product [Didymodactylos carnosus]|uniref:Uncharacterized protein n=1 Tax=Didymodactylos carnosus TaxID=1234261 RepID=A0A814EPK1_9BILA|nr:unnamed protein product [Didymodactylos carnosus]CAF3745293.1 unnamed protein product [Didymodactylos carnosus]
MNAVKCHVILPSLKTFSKTNLSVEPELSQSCYTAYHETTVKILVFIVNILRKKMTTKRKATSIKQVKSAENALTDYTNELMNQVNTAIIRLPSEITLGIDIEIIKQRIVEAFYAYEAYLPNFVVDRDMPNVIWSLGFVPSHNEMNQLLLNPDHHLIHILDFSDVIVPKMVTGMYKEADENYLLKCFIRLDQHQKGFLHKKLYVQTLREMEDILDENEAQDLLQFLTKEESLNPTIGKEFFEYKRYIKHLLPQRHKIYLDLGVLKSV